MANLRLSVALRRSEPCALSPATVLMSAFSRPVVSNFRLSQFYSYALVVWSTSKRCYTWYIYLVCAFADQRGVIYSWGTYVGVEWR